MLLFTKPRQGPGAVRSRADERTGEREQGRTKMLPRLEIPLRTHGASITRGTKRAKAVAGASLETLAAPKLARLSLDNQRDTRSLPSAHRVRAGAASPAPIPAPAAERCIRALTCLRSRPRPAQPPHGPQPARRPSAPFCQLRPRPAPGRWDRRSRRNLGAASLNSRELSLLGFSMAEPVRPGPDVKRTTAGSSLLSSMLASCPTHLRRLNF